MRIRSRAVALAAAVAVAGGSSIAIAAPSMAANITITFDATKIGGNGESFASIFGAKTTSGASIKNGKITMAKDLTATLEGFSANFEKTTIDTKGGQVDTNVVFNGNLMEGLGIGVMKATSTEVKACKGKKKKKKCKVVGYKGNLTFNNDALAGMIDSVLKSDGKLKAGTKVGTYIVK